MIRENKHVPLVTQANAAFHEAAHDVVRRARQANTAIVVWRDGKVCKLTPEQAEAELADRAANPTSKSDE